MPDIPDFLGGKQYSDAWSKPMYQEKNESTPHWGMTRKCHNHIPQTNQEDNKEETQNTDSHTTARA